MFGLFSMFSLGLWAFLTLTLVLTHLRQYQQCPLTSVAYLAHQPNSNCSCSQRYHHNRQHLAITFPKRGVSVRRDNKVNFALDSSNTAVNASIIGLIPRPHSRTAWPENWANDSIAYAYFLPVSTQVMCSIPPFP